MIKSKVSVFARLKPKNSQKSKIIYQISSPSSQSTQSVSKLTITNKRQNENIQPNSIRDKPKSSSNKHIALNSKGFSKKVKHNPKFFKRLGLRSLILAWMDSMEQVEILFCIWKKNLFNAKNCYKI